MSLHHREMCQLNSNENISCYVFKPQNTINLRNNKQTNTAKLNSIVPPNRLNPLRTETLNSLRVFSNWNVKFVRNGVKVECKLSLVLKLIWISYSTECNKLAKRELQLRRNFSNFLNILQFECRTKSCCYKISIKVGNHLPSHRQVGMKIVRLRVTLTKMHFFQMVTLIFLASYIFKSRNTDYNVVIDCISV